MPKQVLLTAEIRRAIPPLYANEDKAFDDVIVVAKLNPHLAAKHHDAYADR